MMDWSSSIEDMDWRELSELYRLAPLGNKPPEWLQRAYGNSMFHCIGRDAGRIVAAGRAVADGTDCSYLCDIAVMPSHQGTGLGREVVQRLVDASRGHRKIILYAVPGREAFYGQFGFRRMRTAMAIFENPERAVADGYIDPDPIP
jgi:GNAT superfamily N-acetyltransferase